VPTVIVHIRYPDLELNRSDSLHLFDTYMVVMVFQPRANNVANVYCSSIDFDR